MAKSDEKYLIGLEVLIWFSIRKPQIFSELLRSGDISFKEGITPKACDELEKLADEDGSNQPA
ncbi:MAG: hypothetical protein Q7R92_02450 [bacterium]|nr:hypothetical protein [bacterium]